MQEIFGIIGIATVLITVVAVSWSWQWGKSNETLEAWAASEGLTIVSSERRYLRRGGYWLTSGKGQEVFYVTVRDQSGHTRSAYVRVGGYFMGQFSDHVDVSWE